MKKIKIERNNLETGEDEAVALDASSSSPNEAGDKMNDKNESEYNNTISTTTTTSNNNNNNTTNDIGCSNGFGIDSASIQMGTKGSPSASSSSSSSYDVSQASNVNVVVVDQQTIANQEPSNMSQSSQAQPSPPPTQPRAQFQNIQRSLPPGAPANYCNICNKELCNKYFMKTHMQKMHGINLDEYPREAANSGGVVCDICQKELCSKYFLKVHKSNTHGITDFSSGSANSQAANAATAVAAIALTNYSLNNAQKRAAINLALNQHQLQNRQAAAFMNAAAASAAFANPIQMNQATNKTSPLMQPQRSQLGASSLIEHLNQHQQQQQQQQHHQNTNLSIQQQLPQPQQFDIGRSRIHSPTDNLTAASIPAALIAATANPLLAAQLAQQHQLIQIQNNRQQSHTSSNQNNNPGLFPFTVNEQDSVQHEIEDDASDRDSLPDQAREELMKNPLNINNFHQHLQNQHQALLNVVFNPAAAAAAMVAMQQQQQQQQLQQQQQQQHHQEQQMLRLKRLEQQSTPFGGRQQTAMDLRNQSFGQLLAQQMGNVRQQEQQLINDCNNIIIDNNNAQLHATHLYNQRDISHQHSSRLAATDDAEEGDDDFDSDRGSLVDENIFRQTVANVALLAASTQSSLIGGLGALADKTTCNTNIAGDIDASPNNDRSPPLNAAHRNNNDNDEDISMINCLNGSRRVKSKDEELSHHRQPHQQHQNESSKSSLTSTNTGVTNTDKITTSRGQVINKANTSNRSNSPAGAQDAHRIPSLNASTNAMSVNTSSLLGAQTFNQSSASTIPNLSQRTPPKDNSSSSHSNATNNNSRYLRHYTEACLICDRRFKSIKWLQSHMMNDHKTEVGNLLGLILQVLLGNNNVAANANTQIGPNNEGTNNINQALGTSLAGVAGLGAPLAAGLAGSTQSAAGLVGVVDLQQVTQQQQLQNPPARATPTATRD